MPTPTGRPLHAQEVGRQLTFETSVDLAGTSVNLRVKRGDTLRDLPLAVSGTIASRATLATDFPEKGRYTVQVLALWPSGRDWKSDTAVLEVQGNL